MQNNLNKTSIDKLDEALRLLWLEASQKSSLSASEEEWHHILSSVDRVEMSADKQKELIDELCKNTNTISFGELVTTKMSATGITDHQLTESIQLSPTSLQDLKTDAIYPISIPVVLLKRLLNDLSISFKAAEIAMWKTFEIREKRDLLLLLQPARTCAKIAARRQQFGRFHRTSMTGAHQTEGNKLYENEDAMFKYLRKLEDLMS